MPRTTLATILASVVYVLIMVSAMPGHAALCRAKKGVLLLRDECRGAREAVDLVGTGSPRIVDASGREVGLVTSLDLTHATILRSVTLPDKSRTEWVALPVTPDGFAAQFVDDAPIHFEYATANCTGTRFLSAEQYSGITRPTFARVLFRQPGKTVGVFARHEELVTQQYYGKYEQPVVPGADPAEACTNRNSGAPPAALVEGAHPCAYNADETCVACCGPVFDFATKQPIVSVGAPAYEFDPATLELTPPFSLSR